MPPPTYEASLRNWRQETLSWKPEHLSGFLPTISCSACSGKYPPLPSLRGNLDDHDNKQGLDGLFAFLGVISTLPQGSTLFDQAHVGGGAGSHPALILCQSTCGHLVFCAPVTSFSQAGGLVAKYAFAQQRDILWRYLAVAHQSGAKSPNGMDLLECDFETPKPSFVNLDQGYWIEWRNLSRFRSGGNQCRLSPTSFHQATWAYHRAERHRAAEGKTAQKNVWSGFPPHQVPSLQYNQHANLWNSGKQYSACLSNWRHSGPLNVATTGVQPAAVTSKPPRQQDSTRFSMGGRSTPLSVHATTFRPANANQSCSKPSYQYGNVGPAYNGFPYYPWVPPAA